MSGWEGVQDVGAAHILNTCGEKTAALVHIWAVITPMWACMCVLNTTPSTRHMALNADHIFHSQCMHLAVRN